MHSVRSTVLLVAWLVAATATGTRADAQAPAAGRVAPRAPSVRGTAVDGSLGVLPGVVVVAKGADGRTLATAVTDTKGEFVFEGLPPGPAALTFQLDGFVEATTAITLPAAGAVGAPPVVQRLELAARAESVTVRDDPAPPPPPSPPTLTPVPRHDEASVCGPAKAQGTTTPGIGTIRSSRKAPGQGLLAAGDEVVIDRGPNTGLAVGQNYTVRRRYQVDQMQPVRSPTLAIVGEHAAGVVQIVAVEDRVASAIVVYACDAMMPGDYLAAFEPEPIRAPEPFGAPAFDKGVRLLFGDAGEMVGVPRRMLVIGQGRANGVRPGQRFTLFRRTVFDKTPTVLGHAVVVAARADSATIRIEHAGDAVFFGPDGDWAAPERPPQVSQR